MVVKQAGVRRLFMFMADFYTTVVMGNGFRLPNAAEDFHHTPV